jgi:hypothetical protein
MQAGRKLDRMSEADNDYAMGILTNNYVKALSQRGLPITDQTLYAMHLKGNASWVEKAIKNPNAPVEAAFTQEEIRANKSYLQGKTLGQALNILGIWAAIQTSLHQWYFFDVGFFLHRFFPMGYSRCEKWG